MPGVMVVVGCLYSLYIEMSQYGGGYYVGDLVAFKCPQESLT